MRLTQTQLVEICSHHATIHAFDFIDGQQYRAVNPAQQLGNILVQRCDAFASINNKDDAVCFVNGLLGLARHFLFDAFARLGFETARINGQETFATHLAMTIVTVTG